MTHQVQWLCHCDLVIVVRAGAIAAVGDWDTLLANPELYEIQKVLGTHHLDDDAYDEQVISSNDPVDTPAAIRFHASDVNSGMLPTVLEMPSTATASDEQLDTMSHTNLDLHPPAFLCLETGSSADGPGAATVNPEATMLSDYGAAHASEDAVACEVHSDAGRPSKVVEAGVVDDDGISRTASSRDQAVGESVVRNDCIDSEPCDVWDACPYIVAPCDDALDAAGTETPSAQLLGCQPLAPMPTRWPLRHNRQDCRREQVAVSVLDCECSAPNVVGMHKGWWWFGRSGSRLTTGLCQPVGEAVTASSDPNMLDESINAGKLHLDGNNATPHIVGCAIGGFG